MSRWDDQRELEELHAKFGHAADRRDYELMRSLYWPGAVEEHGGFTGTVEGYIEWLRSIQDQFEWSSHNYMNMLASFDGNRAESMTRTVGFLRVRGHKPYNVIAVGRHFDNYERRDGVWKFVRRRIAVDWTQTLTVDNGSSDIVAGIRLGCMDRSDPAYADLPDLMAKLGACAC